MVEPYRLSPGHRRDCAVRVGHDTSTHQRGTGRKKNTMRAKLCLVQDHNRRHTARRVRHRAGALREIPV